MKKIETRYQHGPFTITVNEEVKNHMSIHDGGEPCSGVLKHWGTKQELISGLESAIAGLKNLP